MQELTTTSFALLSLLAVRDWTGYELAQQMERSVGLMWSRAASVVYEEPKRLERQGLATSRKEYTGKRASTVYSITAEGRKALADWLSEPGANASLEFEALLKVAFADQGSLDGLRTNLAAIRQFALDDLAQGEVRLLEYAETGGPFPERLPVIALVVRYFQERAAALERWVDWAEDITSEWTGVTPETGARVPPDAFEPMRRRAVRPDGPTSGRPRKEPRPRAR
jgi:PadR family transcriptional regulator, regulatory protein AphA